MESTLTLKKADFESKVGDFLGWGFGADQGDEEWDANKITRIKDCIDAGYHQFLYPPPLRPGEQSYDWSFLRPVAALTLLTGAATVALPDDFGGFEGRLTVSSTASRVYQTVPLMNEGYIREAFTAYPDTTGSPVFAAVRPLKGSMAVRGQRFELYVYPTADADYTMTCPYYILAECLSPSHPFAYGGMIHSQTILESCLAIAEQRRDDVKGLHSMQFMERLSTSISSDRRLKPQRGGRNDDHFNEAYADRHQPTVVTYNGTEW